MHDGVTFTDANVEHRAGDLCADTAGLTQQHARRGVPRMRQQKDLTFVFVQRSLATTPSLTYPPKRMTEVGLLEVRY